MAAISPLKAGLALGTLMGSWHLLWAVLVALGWAQAVIDFVFWMHFLKPVYVVGAFNPGIALILIAVTGAAGAVVGYAFALIWNRVHRP